MTKKAPDNLTVLLFKHKGNKAAIARELGVSRWRVWEWCKKCDWDKGKCRMDVCKRQKQKNDAMFCQTCRQQIEKIVSEVIRFTFKGTKHVQKSI